MKRVKRVVGGSEVAGVKGIAMLRQQVQAGSLGSSRTKARLIAAVAGLASALGLGASAIPASAANSPLDRTNTLLDRDSNSGNARAPGISGVRPRAPAPIRSIVPNTRRGGGASAAPVQTGIHDVRTRSGRVRVISPEIAERYGITSDIHANEAHSRRDGTRVSVGSSGFSARGTIDGDDFRLSFSLGNNQYYVPGTGLVSIQGSRAHDGTFWGGAIRSHVGVGGSFFSTGTSWRERCPYGRCGTVVIQSPAFIDPTWIESAIPVSQIPATPPQPPRELTAFDHAQDALFSGSWDTADAYLLSHLEQFPHDADALRLLAITRLETGRPDDAIALMAAAYEKAPYLAATPLHPGEFDGGDRAMRQRVRNAVTHAHRRDTASAWLLVTVLMQAEGSSRYPVAGNMLVRSAERGLDTTIVRLMAEALGLRPARINTILDARGDQPLVPPTFDNKDGNNDDDDLRALVKAAHSEAAQPGDE
jgi:hypothetical protein